MRWFLNILAPPASDGQDRFMKLMLAIAVLMVQLVTAHAQLFGRESLGGAAVGGIIGGVIGHNSGRRTAEGAAIGAGAGLVLGAIVGQERREYSPQPAPVYYSSPRPNYAVNGAILGGVAGGIIGHNSGRRTAEGVAIGAGAGLLLGAIAEQDARRRETVYLGQPVVYQAVAQPVVVGQGASQAEPQPQAAPQPVQPIIQPPGQASQMALANGLFGR